MAVLTEQDGKNYFKMGMTIPTIWIFSAIFLRNLYNSTLYSFMTAEQEPTDFPKNIQETVDRNDFDLILSFSLSNQFNQIFYRLDHSKPTKQLTKLYIRIMAKSSFMLKVPEDDVQVHIKTLQNAIKGDKTKILYYNLLKPYENVTPMLAYRQTNLPLEGEKVFSKFAVLCQDGDCEGKWNAAFFRQTKLHRIVPKQIPFFRNVGIWTQDHSTIVTASFHKFLGRIVQSGLYELFIKRYRLLEKLKLLQSVTNGTKSEISNGSLFSYVFLAGNGRNGGEDYAFNIEAKSTKITAFTGTFFITGIMLSLALIIILLEMFWRPI
ncbi:unnamed protein product [Orchesella dallaii]|uniref:Uncharacterized protein n=1 Tax=Orchesella dallaii TaxID=48710 RepID=A0ABP1RIT3_9HEXA